MNIEEMITRIEFYVILGVLVIYVIKRIFHLLHWDRGILILDEIQRGLDLCSVYILKVKRGSVSDFAGTALTGVPELSVTEIAGKVAAETKGLTTVDVEPVIKALVSGADARMNGIEINIEPSGKINVNPTGLIQKYSHKLVKWIRKVF